MAVITILKATHLSIALYDFDIALHKTLEWKILKLMDRTTRYIAQQFKGSH